MIGDGFVADSFAVNRVADVADDRDSFPTECADVVGGAVEALFVTANENAVGADVRDGQSHFATETSAAASNEESLAVESKSIEYAHEDAPLVGW